MDIKRYSSKITNFLKKYKYAAIVLTVGIALMLLPNTSKANKETSQSFVQSDSYNENIEETLSELLSNVEGAGRVELILTVAKGTQKVYQTNTTQSTTDQNHNLKSDTVLVTDNSRAETGLVTRTDPAKYLGALILCQGADRPEVKLALIEAVSKITGLGSDKICVLKMK